MPDDKKPHVFSDGTDNNSADTRSQAQKDADAAKRLDEKKKKVAAQEKKKNDAEKSDALKKVNTQGKIIIVSPPGKTPEKMTMIEEIQAKIKEAQEGLKEALGLNSGTDKLGAGQAAKDGIDSARTGGYEIKVGVTGKVTTPIPGVDPIKIGKADNIFGTKGGVPCDTDAGEIGIGSSYLSKLLSKLKYAKKIEKHGVKGEGNIGVSVKADVACINTEKAGKGVLGTGVHAIENTIGKPLTGRDEALKAAERSATGE
jgi:hypothetical protein